MPALHRSLIVAAVLCAVAAIAAGPATADYYDVILANKLVCRLRDAGGYGSVSERGSAVEKNVVEALSVENVGSPRMSIKTSGGLPAIYVGGTFLVQVRSGDAAGTGSSVSSLARQWMAAFKQQFPRAEPVTKAGRAGGAAASTGGSGPAPAARKPVEIPEADKALVEEVAGLLTDARALTAEDFEAKGLTTATEIAALVWRSSLGAETCEGFDALEGKDPAIQSTLNGLKFARELSDEAFGEQRTLVAFTIVKRVRAAVVPAN